jgi:hypothetical protein
MSRSGVAYIIVFVLVLAAGFYWLDHRTHVPTEPAITDARTQSAIAKTVVETVTVQLTARVDTVRAHAHVDTVTIPKRVLVPTTRIDTIEAVRQLPLVAGQLATCREDRAGLLTDCDRFKLAAEARFRADSTTMQRQQAALDARRIPSRWSIGVSGGYGGTLERQTGRVVSGPSLCLCVQYRLF